uniref:Uncharacterized protein n=1 Tax=Cyprinus carpio TaxID=7962 RepID=A0A8C2H6Z8_CYPCA
ILSFVSTQRRKHTATQARGRTRVNIGAAFQRWRELKEREGLEVNAEVKSLNRGFLMLP